MNTKLLGLSLATLAHSSVLAIAGPCGGATAEPAPTSVQEADPAGGAPLAQSLPGGFIEAFALADNREAALEQLIPGTQDHSYYRSLFLQGRFAGDPDGRASDLGEVDRILKGWKRRDRSSQFYKRIQWRQALLRASTDPAATYKFLGKNLGLNFAHRRVVPGAVSPFPTVLDQEIIATEALLGRLLKGRGSEDKLKRMRPELLEQLVRRDLTNSQRATVLDELPRADVPGLVELILADLAAHDRHRFGSRRVHSELTLAQLETLRGALPDLLSNRDYVYEVMRRLAIGPDGSFDDPVDRRAYLDRAWRFVETLPPVFNSLKGHLLYRLLEDDLDRGEPSAARLRQYLALPRPVHYSPHTLKDGSHLCDLNEGFKSVTPYSAIRHEWDVVNGSLQRILRGEQSPRAFSDLIQQESLGRVFAETKLIYGDPAEAEQHVRGLGGAMELEKLRARVEVEFARQNQEVFGPRDAVELAVDIKNVDSLIVKAFQIDPVAVFDRSGSLGVGTLDLDGLVASDERVIRYQEPSLTRHRETLRLDSLDGPGLYIVELIGGGVSSRAVIFKGSLHLLERVGSAGHVFRVIDQDRKPAPNSILRYGGRDFLPDDNGEIHVPFTTKSGTKSVLLRSGDIASLASFKHAKEKYKLEGRVFAPSEALLSGMAATFLIRPRLTVGGELIDVSLLEDARVVIGSLDRDGNRSSKVVTDLELKAGGILSADVQVPERTTEFSVQLLGNTRSLSEEKDVALSSETAVFPINRLQPLNTMQSLLTRRPKGYLVEIRGRAGEPRPGQEITLALENRYFGSRISVRLKSDEDGRVDLGRLADVSNVAITEPSELRNYWAIESRDVYGLSSQIHGCTGDTLRVPYTGSFTAPDRRAFSLLEIRSGEVLRDVFGALSVANRYLEISGLTPGDYRLHLKETNSQFDVRIVGGAEQSGYAVGDHRALSATDRTPLQIARITRDGDDLIAQLGGVNQWTRLHVVATKYVGPSGAANQLALKPLRVARTQTIRRPRATHESGRIISDEYRYILHRRQQTVYPGNMLQRPGYLLNPWVTSRTDDRMAEDGSGGEAHGEKMGGRFGGSKNLRAGGRSNSAIGGTPSHNRTLDFLGVPGTVLSDLVPDEEGRVRIPMGAFGPNHILRIVATDHALTVALDVTRAEVERERRDLRLADPLDPARAMTQQRRVLFAKTGESIGIRDAAGAGAQTYDSLGDVYSLFRTVAGESSELVKFEFLTRWPSLTEEEKLEKYSEFVCHELNVFIKRKDPAFFESVVLPYIANKGHRTFMDDWLLGADLAMHLEPWSFDRLNVVERILLLRSTDGEAAAHAEDLMGLVPRGTFSMERAFGQVLLSGKLEVQRDALQNGLASTRSAMKAPAARPSPRQRLAARGEAVVEEAEEVILEDFEVLDRNETDTDGGDWGDDSPFNKDDSNSMIGIGGGAGGDMKRRGRAKGFFFRDLERTQELAEMHYWQVRLGATRADLISVSPFWVDFARADGAFISGSFPLATRNTAEMLLALAMLDLPFEAAEHKVEAKGRSITMTAGSPLLLALEDIGDAKPKVGAPVVLVGQDYFRPESRTKTVDGAEVEDYVSGEFLTGRAYGSRVVITNPTSASIELQALVQIPKGSVPLAKSHVTHGKTVALRPYGSHSLETFFYFPSAGEFVGYPVHVGQGDILLGAAEAVPFLAVPKLSQVDKSTWDWISQNGELGDVLTFLRDGNPLTLNLEKIAWRMGESAAFAAITKALGDQNVYSGVLWQYSIKHQDSDAATEFLGQSLKTLAAVGAPFTSELFTVNPEKRALYEHLAYEPLVSGRTYAFGGRREILNDQFKEQYMAFLGHLALGSGISSEERMELCYYLLLQERVGEALATFKRVERADVKTKIQYDYMAAHLAFYREDVAGARAIAERYADHPVARWKNRFGGVLAQVLEIEGRGPQDVVDPDSRDQSQGTLASNEPVLTVQVEDGRLIVDYERVGEVEVRYHRMDIEFLFSNSPFVRGEGGAFGLVQPNRVDTVPLDGGETRLTVDFPDEFQGANVLVEVRGAGLARRTTYFAGDLVVQGLERYGQVRVVDGATKKPLPKTYVKVYAKLRGGKVRFHKDGYTDLRGRFDYVSLSGVEGPPVERYSVLVMNAESGATIQELSPPAR